MKKELDSGSFFLRGRHELYCSKSNAISTARESVTYKSYRLGMGSYLIYEFDRFWFGIYNVGVQEE